MHLSAFSIWGNLKEFLNMFQNVQMGSALVPSEAEVTAVSREPKLPQCLCRNHYLEAGIYHDESKCLCFMVK